MGAECRLVTVVTEDEDARLEIARALLTQAGMLFEDASAEAILVGALAPAELRVRVKELLVANERAGAMLNAARGLLEN